MMADVVVTVGLCAEAVAEAAPATGFTVAEVLLAVAVPAAVPATGLIPVVALPAAAVAAAVSAPGFVARGRVAHLVIVFGWIG